MSADAVGGVWRYALDLGSTLGDRGVRVTLAVLGPSPSAEQLLEAERSGLPVVSRPFRLEWMDEPWDDVARAAEWLLALEHSLGPDVVHLNGFCHAALPWRSPVVVVAHSCVRSWWRAVHGCDAPGAWDTYTQAVRAGLAAAHVVVAPTTAMLRALEQEYGPCSGSRVVANGIRSAAPRSCVKEHAILAAGRTWDQAKNIGALCDVAADLPWPVWVAGEDRSPDGMRVGFGAAHHLGCLSADDLARRYASAAIYALPARYEPFGLSVLEAARAGCALVLGDIPSLRENWDGAAEFVPPNDREALADSLRRLISDEARRCRLSALAGQRSERFSIEATAHAYLRVYESLMPAACAS